MSVGCKPGPSISARNKDAGKRERKTPAPCATYRQREREIDRKKESCERAVKEMRREIDANVDAKKTSVMFLRIAQNGDSVQSLSSAIAPSRTDERRSAHWRLCALDAPGCCSFFVLSTSATLLLEPMKLIFLSSL